MARIGIPELQAFKKQARKFACLTAYDAPTARMLEAAGIPLLLVGDSLGNVLLGYDGTVPVTMEEMLHHARAVRRGAPASFVVADMPFLSYQISPEEALHNAGRFLKEAGADAVKLEGGRPRVPTVRRMVEAGIPVMGHLGLTPQSATLLGGQKVQAREAARALALFDDAQALVEAGVFAIVLECIPQEVGREITSRVDVPTIGIGAGAECDGQILVLYDLLGIASGVRPKFVRQYANIEEQILSAVKRFALDVEQGAFPAPEETYRMANRELRALEEQARRQGDRDRLDNAG